MQPADLHFMRRCIQLAKNGFQNAPPNPMVGAVIVHEGRIIGEGYHVHCGEGHAEVNAFASVKPEDEHLFPESTIYVSLEPCAHYGKTPPCAELIIKKGIKRCVAGCVDPFAKVQGKGISMLREAGVDVEVGLLEEECKTLNKRFFIFHTHHRPFITLKWAQTADGFIAYKHQTPEHTLRISNRQTEMVCHKRRSEHQAILVGINTVKTDNPNLNVRRWTGKSPIPIVLGSVQSINKLRNDTTHTYHLLAHDANTLFFHSIEETLKELYQRGIQSLLVEGGRKTLQSFIDKKLYDEVFVEKGTECIGDGIPAPILPSDTLNLL